MAQKIQTLFIDDIDGGEAEGTVRFGLDGTDYEIDLSAKNAAALRKTLAKYVDSARRAPGASRRPIRGGRRVGDGVADSTAVRVWAKSQGIEVKDRGRVPATWSASSWRPQARSLDLRHGRSPQRLSSHPQSLQLRTTKPGTREY